MVAKIVDGDYKTENSNIMQVDYIEEVLQNAFVAIKTKRGRFYPNKNFGSYIDMVDNTDMLGYILSFARQAVDEIDGVYIKSVKKTNDGFIFKVVVNSKEGEITVNG